MGTGSADEGDAMPLALKLGVAAAIGFAAIASGLFLSRRGRHLVREAMEGRRRTRLEDRVLDALWGEPTLTRRPLDVRETQGGIIELHGKVRSETEAEEACRMVERVAGVNGVINRLVIES